MDWKSYSLIIFCLMFVAMGAGYPGTGSTGATGGSGSVTGENTYYAPGTDPGDLNPTPHCNTTKNENGLWGSGYDPDMWDNDGDFSSDDNGDGVYGDPGCVSPWDMTESSGWDTDLTALFQKGTVSQDENPTVFFSGQLKLGNDFGKGKTANGDPLKINLEEKYGSQVVERHLKRSGTLDEAFYSATGITSDPRGEKDNPQGMTATAITSSELPKGTVITSDAVFEPPVDPDEFSGSTVVGGSSARNTCGDGKYDVEDLGDVRFYSQQPDPTKWTISASTDPAHNLDGSSSPNKNDAKVSCRSDYGRLVAQPDDFNKYDDEDDDKVLTGNANTLYPTTVKDTTVYKQDNLECKDDKVSKKTENGDTDYDLAVDNSWSENNDFWKVDGDVMKRKKCVDIGYTDPEQEGEKRDWVVREPINCNRNNKVNGGARKQEVGASIKRAANDRAATYTDFTAYHSESDERVWCAFDPGKVKTIDADGPKGRGDGFVVINDSQGVIGTRGPKAVSGVGDSERDTVGQMVHTKDYGGALTRASQNYLNPSKQQWSLDCGGESSYCVKYLDFHTSGNADKWSSYSNVGNAVEATSTHTFTPDQSYSVCKFINMVNSNQNSGSDRELIDCDFEASKEASGDMSPLRRPCGNIPGQHLVLAEGNQLSFQKLSERLFMSQSCVTFGEDPDKAGNKDKVSKNACVLGPSVYAEGTVKNVTDLGLGVERRAASPDFEVCLDPPESDLTQQTKGDRQKWDNARNRDNKKDFGGEWYDMDNERVQTYIRANFDEEDYSNELTRIETFMRENPNPQHPNYNPTGGEVGLVLEDDCGNPDRDFPGFDNKLDCEDQTSKANTRNLYYTFFGKILKP